ncbi:MAG TPA: type I phosphomannose isomerase catalytic subunit [Planctomycetota bacterium]|nr:type I phosphomannose isomerase catalytic subunit [Planctomycetota bacterium]
MLPKLYPLLFRRRLLEKVWGARRLERLLGFELPAGKAIGESWELSDHPSGESVVVNGPLAGTSLRRLMEEDSAAICGGAPLAHGGRFPLLVKFLDTADRLSVQVHPDDAKAERLRERDGGKNEAWFVLHADPGAVLWAGVRPGVDRARLAESRNIEECLVRHEPAAGDALAIPAGTLHAIGPGLTLCEVQQTSDVTYRLHDWGRPASASRPLHRDRALEVASFGPAPTAHHAVSGAELPSPGSFTWSLLETKERRRLEARGRFTILVGLAGSADVRSDGEAPVRARAGEAVLIPAAVAQCDLEPRSAYRALVVRAA